MAIDKHEGRRGFTIVELLIVVVVIAILAAITLVTYSGIQQRANNAAIIDAASKSLRMIQAYIAANDKYPATTNLCITTDVGCMVGTSSNTSNAIFNTNIATVGTIPRSVPVSGVDRYGITYGYSTTRTMEGTLQPVVLIYYLNGINQACSLAGVAIESGGDPNILLSSSTGYTATNDAGKTRCRISIPGPSA